MPLLKPPEPQIAVRRFYVRIEEPLARTMERYAEFLGTDNLKPPTGPVLLLRESQRTESLTRADRDLLRDGDKRFQGVLFESLYQKWWAGTMTQPDLQLQFGGSEVSQKRGFSTHLVPENHDIFRGTNRAPIRPAFENEGSKSRSSSGSMSA